MSTVAEIEAAIEKLPPTQLNELLAWIEDNKMLTGLADNLFVHAGRGGENECR